jgi:hypothetical protein
MGAYPMLTAHFAAANLDPQANNWDKVVMHLVTQPSDHLTCIAWTQTEV